MDITSDKQFKRDSRGETVVPDFNEMTKSITAKHIVKGEQLLCYSEKYLKKNFS